MKRNLKAVYQDGVFRPLEPLDLPESRRVTLTIAEEHPAEADDRDEGDAGPFDLEAELSRARKRAEADRRNLLGLLEGWGVRVTKETIDRARQEAWAEFPRSFPTEEK